MLFRKWISGNKVKTSSLPRTTGSRSPAGPGNAFEKASASASHRGSMTVECAFVLPLFLLGMLTLVSFMEIYKIQTEKLLELCSSARKAGMYAYAVGEPEEITLPAVYSFESPIAFIPLPRIWMKNTVTVHCWTGYSGGEAAEDGLEGEEMVYVTTYGGVYHTDASCHHLDLSIHQTTESSVGQLRNQSGEKYYPCEHCGNTGESGGLVYITDSGNRYHKMAGCSGLKRTVRLVKKSELAHLPQCRTCAAAGA